PLRGVLPVRGGRVAGSRDGGVGLEEGGYGGKVRGGSQWPGLEAGELENDEVLRTEAVDLLDDRGPDVPAHDDAPGSEREHALDERRRGGLSLRSGDPDDRRAA